MLRVKTLKTTFGVNFHSKKKIWHYAIVEIFVFLNFMLLIKYFSSYFCV